ncbi:MAG: hypothetical protein ABIF84_02250 [Patescibacteria group bacterium]
MGKRKGKRPKCLNPDCGKLIHRRDNNPIRPGTEISCHSCGAVFTFKIKKNGRLQITSC